MCVKMTSEATCNKKITYSTMKMASIAIRRFHSGRNKLRDTMHAYQCNVCGKYHIGHKYKLNDTLAYLFNRLDTAYG
jgi:hypothetical protein